MAVTYQYDTEQNLLDIHPGEVLTIQDVLAHVNRLMHESFLSPGFIEIVHFEELRDIRISYAESMQLPPAFKKLKEKNAMCARCWWLRPTSSLAWPTCFLK